ncbi:MAG: glycine rich domain-containing protein [Saprospiraceae bacterium]
MNIISKILNVKYFLAFSVQFLLLTNALIAQTTTFNYTGAFQTYTVPPGIASVRIESWGAAGGDASSQAGIARGGKGGYAADDLAVTPGQTLYIYVGGKGRSGSLLSFPIDLAGGFNGGGIGAGDCSDFVLSAGGGASDVRVGGQALANRVLVAGGGGGASSLEIQGNPDFGLYDGGFGGFPNGGNGTPNPSWTGLGGTQTSGQCVGGATPPVFGLGYDYCGQLGEGGFSTGSLCNSGGGGGLYGGSAGRGAGGGSSFLGSLLNTEFANGVRSNHGQVNVTASNLLCQNHVNASINASCEVLLTSGTFLSGGTPVGLAVVVKNGSNIIAGPSSSILLNASALNLIGKTYSYEVLSGNNKCWGTVKFEDKTPPDLHCPMNQDVACNTNIGFSASEKEIIFSGSANANQITLAAYGTLGLFLPTITECSAYKLYYSDTKSLNCSGAYVGSVLRTFRVTDAYGNTVSCTQQINLLAPSTIISTPSNITINVCANAIDLANYEPAILASSSNSAISLNAYPAGLHPNVLGDCMLSASKTDKITDNACGKKIVRT